MSNIAPVRVEQWSAQRMGQIRSYLETGFEYPNKTSGSLGTAQFNFLIARDSSRTGDSYDITIPIRRITAGRDPSPFIPFF
jgi:hypothetical protein